MYFYIVCCRDFDIFSYINQVHICLIFLQSNQNQDQTNAVILQTYLGTLIYILFSCFCGIQILLVKHEHLCIYILVTSPFTLCYFWHQLVYCELHLHYSCNVFKNSLEKCQFNKKSLVVQFRRFPSIVLYNVCVYFQFFWYFQYQCSLSLDRLMSYVLLQNKFPSHC